MSDWAPTESRLDYFKNGLAQQLDVTAQLRSDLAEARAEVAPLRAEVDAMGARCRAQEAVIQEHDDAKEAAYAEVAALRGHVELLAEWQAAKRAEEQLLRLQTTAEFGELATAQRAWEAAAVAREAIEERMLAANLSGEEVGRG